MPTSEQPRSGGDVHRRLDSWKEIATHFGVSVRTVQLWEAEQGLPVHRMPGTRGRVFAVESELDEWIIGKEIGDAPAAEPASAPALKRRTWLLGVACLLIAAAAMLWFWPRSNDASAIELRGKSRAAINAKGTTLWEFAFPARPIPRWKRPGEELFESTAPQIGDYDGDGRREVVFTYTAGYRHEHVSEVYFFESDGRLRWKYRPGRIISGPNESFPPPYSIRMTIPVAPRDGRPGLVIVVAYHGSEHPAQVTALSLQGKVMGEYWHSGHLMAGVVADLERDGREELYLAGILNSTRSATLVVLDPWELGGASKEPDPAFQLLGFAAGKEVARIILPESEVTRQTHEFPVATSVRERGGRIELRVRQAYAPSRKWKDVAVEYEFGPRLTLLGSRYSSTAASALERLFRESVLLPYDPAADLERMKQIRTVMPWREPQKR